MCFLKILKVRDRYCSEYMSLQKQNTYIQCLITSRMNQDMIGNSYIVLFEIQQVFLFNPFLNF